MLAGILGKKEYFIVMCVGQNWILNCARLNTHCLPSTLKDKPTYFRDNEFYSFFYFEQYNLFQTKKQITYSLLTSGIRSNVN